MVPLGVLGVVAWRNIIPCDLFRVQVDEDESVRAVSDHFTVQVDASNVALNRHALDASWSQEIVIVEVIRREHEHFVTDAIHRLSSLHYRRLLHDLDGPHRVLPN